jgi:uncharacterized protein YpiB (UPF0302 family)
MMEDYPEQNRRAKLLIQYMRSHHEYPENVSYTRNMWTCPAVVTVANSTWNS